MPSNQEYDQDLLAAAPAPTKAQIQGGYDTRILRQPSPVPPRQDSAPSRSASTAPVHDLESANISKEHIAATSPASRQSFWRSTKGKATIALLTLVILGAIIGGAVGGALSNKNKKSSGSSPNDSSGVGSGSTSASNGDGGLGASGTGSTTNTTPATATATAAVSTPSGTHSESHGQGQSEGTSTGGTSTGGTTNGGTSVGGTASNDGVASGVLYSSSDSSEGLEVS